MQRRTLDRPRAVDVIAGVALLALAAATVVVAVLVAAG
jgi:hypothetical protein